MIQAATFLLLATSLVMAQRKPVTAPALLTAADVKEFAAGVEVTREDGVMGSRDIVSLRAVKDDEVSLYLMLYLESLPPGIKSYPNYAKDRVEQSAAVDSTDEKKVECTVAGAQASGCKEIKSPMGSYREGQRVAKVAFGKGRYFVRIEAFRDFKPDFAPVLQLAERIAARLP